MVVSFEENSELVAYLLKVVARICMNNGRVKAKRSGFHNWKVFKMAFLDRFFSVK